MLSLKTYLLLVSIKVLSYKSSIIRVQLLLILLIPALIHYPQTYQFLKSH